MPPDPVTALARKWCPSIDTLNRLTCTDHAALKKEVEDSIAAAVREALDDVDSILEGLTTEYDLPNGVSKRRGETIALARKKIAALEGARGESPAARANPPLVYLRLYEAALAFCHSIEGRLAHGRASSKEIALEKAVRAIAALTEEGHHD